MTSTTQPTPLRLQSAPSRPEMSPRLIARRVRVRKTLRSRRQARAVFALAALAGCGAAIGNPYSALAFWVLLATSLLVAEHSEEQAADD